MSPGRSQLLDTARIIGGNEQLLLNGDAAWSIVRGLVGIFQYSGGGAAPARARRCLVTVAADETILWIPATDTNRSIAVVPLETTELLPVSIAERIEALVAGDPQAIHALHRWIEILATAMRAIGVEPPQLEFGDSLTPDAVRQRLESLQTAFLDAVDRDAHERDEARRRRFDDRQRVNARVAEHAIAELACRAPSGPARAHIDGSESPLLAAVRRVGDAQGIPIRAPAVVLKSRPSLESILDASGTRSRRVVLAGQWWKREIGPLLAQADTGEPVAVLPERRSWFRRPRYRVVSHAETSQPVDGTIASTLSHTADVLYPPLPDRASALDLLRFALRSHKREIVVVVLTGLATTVLGMLTPQAANLLVEYAVPDADRLMLLHIGVALLVAAAGSLLFDLAQAISLARLVTTAAATAQMGMWDRLLRLEPSFFRQFTIGDIESRVHATTQIRSMLDETTLKVLLGSVVSLLNLILLFYYSVTLALVAVVIAAIALIVNAAAGYFMLRTVRPLQELDGHLRGLLIQLVNAVSKIRIAGAETRAFAQWGRSYTVQQRLTQQLQVQSDRVHVFGEILSPLSTAVLFWFALPQMFGGGPSSLTLGAFIAFSAAFGTFIASATTLGDSSAVLLTVAAVWKRATPILATEPERDAHKDSPGILAGGVRIDHVAFRYRKDGPLTLDDVTIQADPGECIALVGPSGSGKSTLINMLLRFEVPLTGAVYYDGKDFNSLDVLAVRRQLGVVTQDNKMMAGSIYENIVCGSLSTIEDAWRAARAAGFDEDIQQMPMGIHTFISESGGNISGGQRQRLLIARALVQNPRILIFDEATSALDNRTQAMVMDSLDKLQVTRIIVAHRLSTVRHAHRIYVIQAGRVVQQGAFDELMRQEGLFARLMQRQIA